MKLMVHGTCTAVSDGEMLDQANSAAVVRVFVQEFRRKPEGGYEKAAEALFIDLHTGQRRKADQVAAVTKGDQLLIEGALKAGFDCTNRPVCYIEVFEIAVVSSKAMRVAANTNPAKHDNLPPTADDLSGFGPVDVSTLPAQESTP